MIVTSYLFDAYLNCATKCWLRSRDDSGTGNSYADWVKTRTDSYSSTGIKLLMDRVAPNYRVVELSSAENLKNATWRSAANIVAQGQNLQSRIHSLDRALSEDGDKPVEFVPIRFVANNKLTKNDKLLLAFDTLALSEALGKEIDTGKIIHGDGGTVLKVRMFALKIEARKLTQKISILVSTNSPPDLILNRHCAECEFQVQCRQKAVEADDLSLLSGLTDMERSRHRSKGIFAVTQLSYTFRPRKTSKRAKNPPSHITSRWKHWLFGRTPLTFMVVLGFLNRKRQSISTSKACLMMTFTIWSGSWLLQRAGKLSNRLGG